MSIFESIQSSLDRISLLDADAMGSESISYTPAGGSERIVNAIVSRMQRDFVSGVNICKSKLRISVTNSLTTGISTSEDGFWGGVIRVRPVPGGEIESFTITADSLIKSDSSMLTLEV